MEPKNNFLYRTKPNTKEDPYTFHFLYRRLMDLDNMSYRDDKGKIRTLNQYPSWDQVKVVGKYKDYEKGGWYETIELFELNGEFFAKARCSNTMNSVYSEQNNLC